LESEGGPTEWRNLRLQELPASGAKPEESAPEAQGHRAIYTGLDLRGWKTANPERWTPNDWRLILKEGAEASTLATETTFGDCEIIVDAKLVGGATPAGSAPKLTFRGYALELPVREKWQRFTVEAKKGRLTSLGDGFPAPIDAPLVPARSELALTGGTAGVEFANIYVRDL
jgi:hypothetical protein